MVVDVLHDRGFLPLALDVEVDDDGCHENDHKGTGAQDGRVAGRGRQGTISRISRGAGAGVRL